MLWIGPVAARVMRNTQLAEVAIQPPQHAQHGVARAQAEPAVAHAVRVLLRVNPGGAHVVVFEEGRQVAVKQAAVLLHDQQPVLREQLPEGGREQQAVVVPHASVDGTPGGMQPDGRRPRAEGPQRRRQPVVILLPAHHVHRHAPQLAQRLQQHKGHSFGALGAELHQHHGQARRARRARRRAPQRHLHPPQEGGAEGAPVRLGVHLVFNHPHGGACGSTWAK